MNVRFSHAWYAGALGKALRRITGYPMAIPRVGGLCQLMSTPMPTGAPPDLSQCCDERAAWFTEKYQTLYVMWSGGVDSTLVALYLAKHKRPDTKLILSTSEQSLTDASSKVLNTLKSMGYVVEPLDRQRMIDVAAGGGMVVTGHHADSILLGDFVDSTGIYEEIWDMTPVELFMRHAGVSQALAESTLADMEPLLALMPAGMERTAANVGWWLDFSTYWDHDEVEFMLRLGLQPPGVGYITFFSSEGFQLWAQQDVTKKAGKTAGTHKQAYLNLIWGLLGYQEPFVVKNRMEVPFDDTSKMPGPNLLKMREDYSVVWAASSVPART